MSTSYVQFPLIQIQFVDLIFENENISNDSVFRNWLIICKWKKWDKEAESWIVKHRKI